MHVSPSIARRSSLTDRSPRHTPANSRLWLEFVNTDAATLSTQVSPWRDLDSLLEWLAAHGAIDEERAGGISRRAILQPAAAAAMLVDARRVRSALRLLAEKGGQSERVVDDVLAEINRVLGRSAGTRRLDRQPDGQYQRSFVPTGDAFAGLMIPVVESAADTLVAGDIRRVRRCAEPRCHRVFLDTTRNGLRRWCDMGTCGNRAKAARHRAKGLTPPPRERPRARG